MPDETPKKGKERLAKIIEGLSQPSETGVERLRNVAAALELQKVANILDTTNDVMGVVRERLERKGRHYNLIEAAARAGLSPESFRRINLACGFADPGPDEQVFTDEDIDAYKQFQAAMEFFGEETALQVVRVIGSSMARCADAFVSAFVHAIGAQSQSADFTDEDLVRANDIATEMLPNAVHTMDILLRRHLEQRSRTDALLLGEDWEGVDAVNRAIGFCDLVGYTALSQQISTEEMAQVLSAFETIAFDVIIAKGGSVVKLIGDEVMFVAPNARSAAEIALSLAEAFAGRRDVPPVRIGIAAGRVVTREGDYFGPVVNLAARIVKLADPSTVLAPASIVGELDVVAHEDAGPRTLKGFDEDVDVVVLKR